MEAAENMAYGTKRASTLADAIDEYLKAKSQSVWSPTGSTYGNASSTLRIFLRCLRDRLGREPLTTDLEDDNVFGVISSRWPVTGTTKTHNVNYARVKAFARWLQATRHDSGVLTVFLEHKPKAPELDVTFIEREEMQKVIDTIYPYAPRDARLIQLSYELSRRAGEMVMLKVKDLQLKRTTVDAPHGTYTYTQRKTGGDRKTTRLTASQRELILTWLSEYESLVGEKPKDEWYLFPASIGTGTAVRGQRRPRRLIPTEYIREPSPVWKNALKDAGVYSRGKGSHAGRRGSLTEDYYAMREAGIVDPIPHLQQKAGHGSRKTTEGYIRMKEAERQSFEALQQIDDIRTGRVQAPASQPETDVAVTDESTDDSGETLATVVYPAFGRKRA
jgi:integrase